MILTAFNKYCIYNTVDVTDNDMVWNYGKKDGNVRGECEENEGTDCVDGDGSTD